MEELEFHWLVGVLEGEGTFLRGAPSKPGTPILRVSMTDRDVVEHVAKSFGRAVVRLRRRKPHHKLPYATTIKGAPAAQLMYAVRPFLGKTRGLQIDRAISSWQTRRGPRHRRRADGSDSLLLMPLADPSGTMTSHPESRDACDRAWIAGLLEGEGSFIANRAIRSSCPVIKVEMCEQEVSSAPLVSSIRGFGSWRQAQKVGVPHTWPKLPVTVPPSGCARCGHTWAFGELRLLMRRSRPTTQSG